MVCLKLLAKEIKLSLFFRTIKVTAALKVDAALKADAANVAAIAMVTNVTTIVDGALDHVQHSGLSLPPTSLKIAVLHSGRVLCILGGCIL